MCFAASRGMAPSDDEWCPSCVVVFSGKRKSGKDYVTSKLQERFGSRLCSILRLSGPLKYQYAKENNLDVEKLMDASPYKEIYREDMIKWGEEKRNMDPGYFCSLATKGKDAEVPVWLISDARRKTDLAYFREKYKDKVFAVRVTADEDSRKTRGWVFQTGVDDAESECGLDNVADWDFIVENNGKSEQLDHCLKTIIDRVTEKVQS